MTYERRVYLYSGVETSAEKSWWQDCGTASIQRQKQNQMRFGIQCAFFHLCTKDPDLSSTYKSAIKQLSTKTLYTFCAVESSALSHA